MVFDAPFVGGFEADTEAPGEGVGYGGDFGVVTTDRNDAAVGKGVSVVMMGRREGDVVGLEYSRGWLGRVLCCIDLLPAVSSNNKKGLWLAFEAFVP